MVLARRSELEHWLSRSPEAVFPATRDDVVVALERAGAPDEVVAAVRAIPPETYSRQDQVAAAAEAVPDVTSESTTRATEERIHMTEPKADPEEPPRRDEP